MSKNFIDTDYFFDENELVNAKIFTVSRRQLFLHKSFFEFLFKKEMPKCERQHNLQVFVEHCRHELKGCHVFAFRWNLYGQRFEIGVQHKNLPASPEWCVLEDEPLLSRVAVESWFDDDEELKRRLQKGGSRAGKTLPKEEKWELIAAECEPSEEDKPETWRDRESLL